VALATKVFLLLQRLEPLKVLLLFGA